MSLQGSISLLWLTLMLYWVISSLTPAGAGRGRWIWWREITMRLGFFALFVLLLELAASRQLLPNAEPLAAKRSAALVAMGLLIAGTGVALAMAARACLGPRLCTAAPGAPISELCTSGPYALVRHPLYGGLLLAMLGSAIAQSSLWLLPLLVYAPAFILSARREEQRLLAAFPDRYAAYRRGTRMLLPWLL
jgi:protein-S-isoprenylcysteine O-methyltransferase Ste14